MFRPTILPTFSTGPESGLLSSFTGVGTATKNELCFSKPLLIAYEIFRRLADHRIADLICRVYSALILLDTMLVVIESYYLHVLGKLNCNRHP